MMPPLEAVLSELAATALAVAGAPEDGVRVSVTDAELDVPLETRPGARGQLLASLPRGRLVTGFAPVLGRLRATFGHSEDAP
jgi:hypothetical protein